MNPAGVRGILSAFETDRAPAAGRRPFHSRLLDPPSRAKARSAPLRIRPLDVFRHSLRLRTSSVLRWAALGAVVAPLAACSGAPSSPSVDPRDLASAANANARQSLGGSGSAVTLAGPVSNLALAEESSARRAALRRAFTNAKKEQDQALDRRQDDLSFLEAFRPKDRNDSLGLYLHGRGLGLLGRIDEALLEFESAALADPKNPYAYEGLGVCHYRRNEFDRAIVQFQKALQVDPELSDAHFALARAYEGAGRMPDAIAAAEAVVRTDDDPCRGPLLLAELRLKRNETAKAIEVLEAAIRKHANEPRLRLVLAEAYDRVGKASDAAAQVDAVVAASPLSVEQLHRFALLYRRSERFDRAEELLDRLLREAPETHWKMRDREAVVQLLETVRAERAQGRRLRYSPDELLSMLVHHTSPEKRLFAAEALRPFVDGEVTRAYVAALKDASGAVRAVAVDEVGIRAAELGASALSVLAGADPDPRVRAVACRALGRIGAEKGEAALLDALLDPEQDVRVAANAGLETLCGGRILFPSGVSRLDEEARRSARADWARHLEERRAASTTNQRTTVPAR